MGLERSKIVKTWKHENQKPAGYVMSSAARQRYFTQYVPLHRAALTGDWKTAEKLLRKDSTLAATRITEGGETALHIAAVEGHAYFVAKLLEKMKESDLEIQNEKHSTALCFAAAGGHLDIAELMVEMNPKLPTIGGEKWVTPVYMAVLQGYKEMAEYLFPLSDFQSWIVEDQAKLVTTSIHSGLYGLAVSILNQHKMLVVVEDNNGETPLEVLASRPLTFYRIDRQGLWGENIASTMLYYIKSKGRHTSTTCDAYTLLDCLWESIVCQEDVETAQFPGHITKSLFVAAESGNEDFLIELIGRYPDFIYKVNNQKHSIFHIAVSQRYVKVFNLIYELHGVKDLILSYIDKNGNNILHLAAKLAPSCQLNHIPGAALQMQQELLWYKEVEKIVQPSYRNMKNSDGQTPYDLFFEEHKNLMKEGEKQMTQSAKSLMLVTVLIATLVFASAFTVPDRYNMVLILQHKKLLKVFPISEAIATLASLTSMLMFLSALTSHYSENNFMRSMALSLGVGVAALFVSIVAMMVVFCSYLLLYGHGLPTSTALLVLFSCVPIMFVILKCPLLFTLIRCTYGRRWLFTSNDGFY